MDRYEETECTRNNNCISPPSVMSIDGEKTDEQMKADEGMASDRYRWLDSETTDAGQSLKNN